MSKESKSAGGLPAIVATVKTLSAETGLIRGARTMLKVNQFNGIDCPGCAWPEPDRERSHFEFCENGAKHIADEATTKRVTPEFFQQWSVAGLEQQSDQWLGAQGRITHPMCRRAGGRITNRIGGMVLSKQSRVDVICLNIPTKPSFNLPG